MEHTLKRGLIPVWLTLLAISFGLLLASCNDSAVSEIELPVPDEEQIELIPPSANPEPPELVAAYEDLWMEISYEQERGILNSTKVMEANRLAIELSKYDGPMGRVFETLEIILDANAAGKSEEEIKEIVAKNSPLLNSVIGKVSTCENDCWQDFHTDMDRAVEDGNDELLQCGVVGGLGILSGLLTGGVTSVVSAGLGVVCVGFTVRRFYRNVGRAEEDHGLCLRRCRERRGPE